MSKGPYIRRERPGTRAICTCGRSGEMPYCDGAHMGTGFEPLMMNFEVEEEVKWCLCRKSKSFPRCDGSHESGA